MLIREMIEGWEREHLSRYAVLSAESKGRDWPEMKCVVRTDFQRDRDRIIHSKSFRRLIHKTQVFIAPLGDHYRTRLTHTVEVAQIGRNIARALRLNEDLAEAIALGHDLGHTPFGHAGEEALDEAYREYVPDGHFKHAEQSLRVVEVLEGDGKGLNLTWEVRDGILNHAKGEEDIGETEEGPATLEGKIIRVADRIAYINHDIDDAVRAGIISGGGLPDRCKEILGETHSARIGTMVIDIIKNSMAKPYIKLSQAVGEATNELKDFLFAEVYHKVGSGSEEEKEKVRILVRSLFRLYMEQPELMPLSLRRVAEGDLAVRARVACDYIAGMTDRFAKDQYVRHFVPEDWRSM